MHFLKYHALGNDYIVLNPADFGRQLETSQMKLICHRNYGVGSDGILMAFFGDLLILRNVILRCEFSILMAVKQKKVGTACGFSRGISGTGP